MTMAESLTWQKLLLKDRPLIFGVLNCTPDSFSDGGQYLKEKAIFEKLELLVSNGADVIDIGAESTRPGAKEISYEDQMKRLRPAFKYLENISTSYNGNFSIDTRNSNVAKECLSSGINIICSSIFFGAHFIIQTLEKNIDKYSSIILSDYGKGVLTTNLTKEIIKIANKNSIKVLVDPKGKDYSKYKGSYTLTPNKKEAMEATNIDIKDESSLIEALKSLKTQCELEVSLITLSEQGIAIFDDELTIKPTVAREVYDVTGKQIQQQAIRNPYKASRDNSGN